ncbi:hypothetical protein O6H91_05G067200 [Diphasiastrum complanatum]|uniref:Uncharacterized protein n=1 Tax=Diphasiastrum complanatum TaxID=34168 RepID=A0ACC2DP56_DIPCM|nr:hypothetical protein O6H91_05G067200 [Diphasiastrum complanatum]
MQQRLALRDLLCCRIPFAMPSLFSASADEKLSPPYDCLHSPPTLSILDDLVVAEKNSFGLDLKRKAAAAAEGETRKLKQHKGESCLLRVPGHSWVIVGKLQLWNKESFHHPRMFFPSDCIALSDETATVCCTVKNLDPGLLGETVMVTSFNFIPTLPSNSEDFAKKIDDIDCCGMKPVAVTERAEHAAKFSKDHTSAADQYGGLLEIHRLEVFQSSDRALNKMPTFSSLCLSPTSADVRNTVLESPQQLIGHSKPRLGIWGSLYCISPAFKLPWKHPEQTKEERHTVHCKELEKNVLPENNGTKGKSTQNAMLGFLAELHSCKHSPYCGLRVENETQMCFVKGNQSLQTPCTAKKPSPIDFHSNTKVKEHQVVRIYFSGCLAAWRPLLSGALGLCISITGLRRKRIVIGPEKRPCLLFVATRATLVSLLRHCLPTHIQTEIHPHLENSSRSTVLPQSLSPPDMQTIRKSKASCSRRQQELRVLPDLTLEKCNSVHNSKGCCTKAMQHAADQYHCLLKYQENDSTCLHEQQKAIDRPRVGCYVGLITGMYFQGKLIEMDKKVWLLLTHQQLVELHGLRVGAMLALWHVHFVFLQTIWEKALLLGACFLSSIVVVAFSPFQTQPRLCGPKGRLSKLMELTPFASAFWVFVVALTMKLKFDGFCDDKDSVGSKRYLGVTSIYLKDFFVAHSNLPRDPLKEFVFHNEFCQLGESSSDELTWSPPISKFCEHILSSVEKTSSFMFHKCGTSQHKDNSFVRRVISSKELHAVLLGSLQVCETSGKLQLVDCTGVLDVIVPDLSCVSNLQKTYEIADFHVVFESFCHDFMICDMNKSGEIHSCPCSNHTSIPKRAHKKLFPSKDVAYYVVFHLRTAKCLHYLRCPLGKGKERDKKAFQKIESLFKKPRMGQSFDIILLTHKYPVRSQCMDYENKNDQLAFFAEAIVLPFTLQYPSKFDILEEEAELSGVHLVAGKQCVESSCTTEASCSFLETVGCIGGCKPQIHLRSVEAGQCVGCFNSISKDAPLVEIPVSHSNASNAEVKSSNILETMGLLDRSAQSCGKNSGRTSMLDYANWTELFKTSSASMIKDEYCFSSGGLDCSNTATPKFPVSRDPGFLKVDSRLTDGAQCGLFPNVWKALCNPCNRMMSFKPRRVVLEFNGSNTQYHQVVQIGHCYIRPSDSNVRSEGDVITNPCFHKVELCYDSELKRRSSLSWGLACSNEKSWLQCAEQTFVVDAKRPLWRVDFANADDRTFNRRERQELHIEAPTPTIDCNLYNHSTCGRHCPNCKFMPFDMFKFSSSERVSGICSECIHVASSFGCYCGAVDPGAESGANKFLSTSMCPSQSSELCVKLPRTLRRCLFEQVKSLRAQLLPPVLSVKELFEDTRFSGKLISVSFEEACKDLSALVKGDEKLDSMGSLESCLEGSLTSFFGQITKVYLGSARSLGKQNHSSFVSSFLYSKAGYMIVEIQDTSGPQKLTVFLGMSNGVRPLGMAPGAVVSFHRILIQRNTDGITFLQSTATTLSLVHSVQEHSPEAENMKDNFKKTFPCEHLYEDDEDKEAVESNFNKLGSINDWKSLTNACTSRLKISCRVIAIKRLVLRSAQRSLLLGERSKNMYCDSQSCSLHYGSGCVDISAACFILGSS